jgi:hypothetical protein
MMMGDFLFSRLRMAGTSSQEELGRMARLDLMFG